MLINATLDLTSFKSDGGTAKAWIMPNGKAAMVPLQHYIWLDKNRERVKKEFGLTVPPIRGMQDDQMSRVWALKNGFGRVNYKPSSGNLTIEVNERFWTPKFRDAVVALVEKNAGAIDFIVLNILNDAGQMLPKSDSANLSMLDDDEKASKIPVVSSYKRAMLVAAAFRRFKVRQ